MSSHVLKLCRSQGRAALATVMAAYATSSLSPADQELTTTTTTNVEDKGTLTKDHNKSFKTSWYNTAANMKEQQYNGRCLCETPNHMPFMTDQPLHAPPNSTPNTNRRRLQRNQTIGRLNRASIKTQTLNSLYKVDRTSPPLGEGAFGKVYLATARQSAEKVALKKIPKSMTDDESFQREMNALLRIRSSGGHPHICSLHDSFDEGSYYYITLDFIGGGEMFDHLVKSGAYSEANASRLVCEVASALAYLHGIGIVHNDLKPENLMLSSPLASNAIIKLVDFGCATVLGDEDEDDDDYLNNNNVNNTAEKVKNVSSSSGDGKTNNSDNDKDTKGGGFTVAYSPPEALKKGSSIDRPCDMWALGIIIYIMLTGLHPFDITADAPDRVVAERIKAGDFPLRNSPITQHLSSSAIDLIERLIERDPKKRLTADQMLNHPWVTGETATTDIIKGSDKRLSKLRMYKSKIEAKFFQDAMAWSDSGDETRCRTSLLERSFQSLDEKNRGFLTEQDLGENFDIAGPLNSNEVNTFESGGVSLSISDFHSLLSENMKDQFFPKGTVIYHEGDIGNHMYFINSGTIEVVTKDGSRALRSQGDFFGEGALLHPKKLRSATIRCKTPVHAMRISRKYFDKYLSNESGLLIAVREKDKIRKRNRCKVILRLQKTLRQEQFEEGEHLFKNNDDGDSLYIVESGKVDLLVHDKEVFSAMPGNVIGEHSILTGEQRNCTAVCTAKDGCKMQRMLGHDFRKLIDSSPEVYASLKDLCMRRDFKKAVVHRLGMEFPYDDPRKAFDAVKSEPNSNEPLGFDEIKSLMRDMTSEYDDSKIKELIDVIDLTKSGNVSFDEFKKVFIADIRSSASM